MIIQNITTIFTLLINYCVIITHAFNFREVTVYADSLIVASTAKYTFRLQRNTDNSFNPTPASSTPVLNDATTTITFPTQYTSTELSSITLGTLTVDSATIVGASLSITGNTVTINDAFTSLSGSSLNVQELSVILQNVINPYPAKYVDNFQATIGSDYAEPQYRGIQLQPAASQSCKITFDPAEVHQSGVKMIVTVNPLVSLDSSTIIKVQFPTSRKWSNNIVTSQSIPIINGGMTCSVQSGTIEVPTCTGDTTSFSVSASNILSGASTAEDQLGFGISGLSSPPTPQPSDLLYMTIYLGIYELQKCSAYPSDLQPLTITSITPSSVGTMTVNTDVNLKIVFVLPDYMDTYDKIEITFPSQVKPTLIRITGEGPWDPVKHTLTGQKLVASLNSLVTTTFSPGFSFVIIIEKITAPPSTTLTSDMTVAISRNGYIKMQGTTNLQASSGTLTGTLTVSDKTVWNVGLYTFALQIADELTSTGYIEIYFPDSVISTQTTNCATLSGTGVNNVPSCSYDSAQNMITLSNIATGSLSPQTLTINILQVQNPPSIKPTGTFSLKTYYTSSSGSLVAEGVIAGITPTVGSIDTATASIISDNNIVYASPATYDFVFQNTYEIPVDGQIKITIPDDIQVDVASISTKCKISIDSGAFGSTGCTAASNTGYYQITFTNVAETVVIASSSTINLKIQTSFRNPSDTGTVSGFTLTSYHSDTYKIQELLSGLSFSAVTPSTIQVSEITSSSNINSESPIKYTFKMSQSPPLPASSKIIVTFPQILKLTSSSLTTCKDLLGASLTCTYMTVGSAHQLTVTIGATPANSLTQFGFQVGEMRNLPSFAPLSQAFTFLTKSNDGLVSYAQGTFTPSFQNSVTSSFSSITGTFITKILGEATILQVTLTPSGYITPSSIDIAMASSFTLSGALSCTSATCSYDPAISHLIKVTGINSIAEVTISVNGAIAPKSDPSDKTRVTSYDSAGYKIDEDSSILFAAQCTLPCRTCSSGDKTECLSCYQDTDISTFIYYYSANKQCREDCLPETFKDTINFRCMPCDSNCKECENSAANCISCVPDGPTPYLNITGGIGQCVASCGDYHYPDKAQVPQTCVDCDTLHANCVKCDQSANCLACNTLTDGTTIVGYFYDGNCFTDPNDCPKDITIPAANINLCEPCDSVCKTCDTTTDNCIACADDSVLHEGTCKSSCPAPLVAKDGICTTCTSPCLTCQIKHDQCTSCITTGAKYLYGTTCLSACPIQFYEDDAQGKCLDCKVLNIGCDRCQTSSTCQYAHCNDNYVYFPADQKCYSQVPSGYVDISGVAQQCDPASDCSTCIQTIYKCTSCKTLLLQGNKCQSTCDSGYVGVNGICERCTSGCYTCDNLQDNCTSCDDSVIPEIFLTNYRCEQTCPDFTYPNSDTNQCDDCVTPCQKCTSKDSCSSCIAGKFLQDSTDCVDTCRDGYLGIGRLCTKCTSPCDYCEGTLTFCKTCVDTYFLIQATNKCTQDCSTVGLYASISGICTGCTLPCVTCAVKAENCTSCQGDLFLQNNQCISNCGDKFYPINNECQSCKSQCATCSSAAVCLSCQLNFFLLNKNCLEACPQTHPVIKNSNQCNSCSDKNCLKCDQLDQCSSCSYPYLVHAGVCLSQCPTNFTSDGKQCNYDPQQQQTPTNQTLNDTLSSENLFPVPFTIAGTFIGIACLMSKFQHSFTFIFGALYALISPLEVGSYVVAIILYYQRVNTSFAFTQEFMAPLIFLGAVAFLYLLNILAIFVQNCYLKGDAMFRKWQDKHETNYCWYCVASFIGLIITHKFKNILFCKLFGFQVFKAQLDSVQNFKVFNIFSFLSFISSAGILFSIALLMVEHKTIDQELMAYIDVIILTTVCIVLAILNSCKGSDYFEQRNQDGYILNKRIPVSQTFMNEAVIPMMQEHQNHEGGNLNTKNIFDTQRKFRSVLTETLSQQVTPSIHVQDISIQAAPILQDYSKIDFYNDAEMSSFSMFEKQDKSMNVSHHLNAQDVSVQQQPNVFDQNDASIQNNPIQQDVSIQQNVEQAQYSLQHVPQQDDIGIQMSRQQQDHSIQAVVNHKQISIQYSAKPVFQSISKDFMDDSQDQQFSSENEQSEKQEQIPAQEQKGLKAELELDAEQKLRLREEEREIQKHEERQREKQRLVQAFHREREARDHEKRQPRLDGDNEHEKINQMFNNEESRMDGSSLINSSANQVINFQRVKNTETSKEGQKDQSSQNEHRRLISEKTQKQIINMLSKPEAFEEDLSFNVTEDLENEKQRIQVHYQENDINVDSGEDDLYIQKERQYKPERQILRNDMVEEQMPSGLQKSRSTNFLSTVRRPPRAYNNNGQSRYMNSQDMSLSNKMEEDDPIVDGPIQARKKQKGMNFHEEEINYEPRQNVAQLLDSRRNRNSSAQVFGGRRVPVSNELEPIQDKRQSPLPEVRRMKSEQSVQSQGNKYNMTKNPLLQGQRLQLEFDENDHYMQSQHDTDIQSKPLPRVLKPEPKLNRKDSKSKFSEKSIHRQILEGQPRYNKYYEKQRKKNENTRKKIQQYEARLQRPSVSKQRRYMLETCSSKDKKRKASFEKVYNNNPYEKRD